MRIETLVRSGQADRARTLARDFMTAHPDSPLRDRVARMVGQPPR